MGWQLDAKEARKDQEDGRHLVARDARGGNGLRDSEVDGQGKAIVVEVLLARLGDAHLVAQPLILRLQLLDLGSHRLN
eukprot:5997338-Pleurochrysis_carterae.AAC.1